MKKGFTLIELLAVIVILAIIAVIAVPIVLNIIDDAKQSSTLRSADFYLDAVEMSIAGATLKNQSIKDGTYNTKDGNICLNDTCTEILEVEVNGEVPEIGTITISGGKIVSTQLITNNNMIVKNDKGELIHPTLANTILKGYGGINNIRKLKEEPHETGWSDEKFVYLNISTTLKWGTDYEYDQIAGSFLLKGTITEATITECRNGTKQCGDYVIPYTYDLKRIYKVTKFAPSSDPNNSSGSNITVREKVYGSEMQISITGLYKTEDDLGISYFYRGNIDNNYLRFRGTIKNVYRLLDEYGGRKTDETFDTLEECEQVANDNNASYGSPYYSCEEEVYDDSLYWRIVRINGDGTIRLAYIGAGIGNAEDGKIEFVGKSAYNPGYDEQKYLKYTYEENGKEVDSTVKSYLDNWYNGNLKDKYSKYLSDGIYCNDFEELDLSEFENISENCYSYDDACGISKLYKSTNSFKCLNEESKYSISKNIGNGKLSNPIGLITANEANGNSSWFSIAGDYYSSDWGWTMTPGIVDNYHYLMWGESSKFKVWVNMFDTDGGAGSHNTSGPGALNSEWGVTPVINLKSDVKFKGNGTIDDPYEIIME